jgi:hypothetical protein
MSGSDKPQVKTRCLPQHQRAARWMDCPALAMPPPTL